MSDHVKINRDHWDVGAASYVAAGERHWADTSVHWGEWSIPESELRLLPDDLDGKDTIELGCGTAYVSAWLARLGARTVGIDNSSAQLATARRLQREHNLLFPLLHGDAERLPFIDASFDLAISEYGAAIWCDPYRWIPEAARVLRRGGELVFLGNAALHMLCVPDEDLQPAEDRLVRSYLGMHRFEWPDTGEVEFHIPHGEWIRLLRANGFEVIDLIELQPGPDATTNSPYFTAEWARRWPTEEVWKARKVR